MFEIGLTVVFNHIVQQGTFISYLTKPNLRKREKYLKMMGVRDDVVQLTSSENVVSIISNKISAPVVQLFQNPMFHKRQI